MAMYLQDAKVLKPQVEEAFGKLNMDQLLLVTRLMKIARRSCRSNVALYNFLNILFPQATWAEVSADNKWGKAMQLTYSGSDQQAVVSIEQAQPE